MTKLRILRRLPARLKGLMFTQPTHDIAMLVPCNDIHTFGMRYALDIAFIDRRGKVLRSFRNVGPGCRLRCSDAIAVLERAYSLDKQWFRPGKYAGNQIHKAIQ